MVSLNHEGHAAPYWSRNMKSLGFYDIRVSYHATILESVLGPRPNSGALSNADSSNKGSKELARRVALKLCAETSRSLCKHPPSEQTVGNVFASLTKDFLDKAFQHLHHLRPGKWLFSTSQDSGGIANFYQYEHLARLEEVLQKNPDLRSTLGGDYFITPDITIARTPVKDSDVNKKSSFLTGPTPVARYAPLRESVNKTPLLHASVSCKWTIRSDRAQNTRTEALNLIRNRKGKVPIVVAVTFEPLPTRIASIALGTGDLDCTYHAALHELQEAVEEAGNEDQKDMLTTLVDGRRLRDISDLPFDLAI